MGLNVPGPHAVHAELPVLLLNCPGKQAMHTAPEESACIPAGHASQLVLPEVVLTWPAPQAVQPTPFPGVPEYVPGGHRAHVALVAAPCDGRYVPDGHGALVAFVLPSGQ